MVEGSHRGMICPKNTALDHGKCVNVCFGGNLLKNWKRGDGVMIYSLLSCWAVVSKNSREQTKGQSGNTGLMEQCSLICNELQNFSLTKDLSD